MFRQHDPVTDIFTQTKIPEVGKGKQTEQDADASLSYLSHLYAIICNNKKQQKPFLSSCHENGRQISLTNDQRSIIKWNNEFTRGRKSGREACWSSFPSLDHVRKIRRDKEKSAHHQSLARCCECRRCVTIQQEENVKNENLSPARHSSRNCKAGPMTQRNRRDTLCDF